jgi:hypothetical protein
MSPVQPFDPLPPLEVSTAPTVALARPLCGAETRNKTPCKQDAGARTPHHGEGRCWLHGGLTPIKHGGYSKVSHPRLRELLTDQEANPDPLNMLPHLHVVVALAVDYINRYVVLERALTDWHLKRWLDPEEQEAMYDCFNELEIMWKEGSPYEALPEQLGRLKRARLAVSHLGELAGDRPESVPDLASVYRLVSEATKIIERLEKIRSANAISRPDLNRIMNEMGRVVATYVDPPIAQKIREGWLELIRV